MGLYLTIIFLAVINFIIQSKRNFKFLNVLLFLFMFAVCAFRDYSVGSDTETYLKIYTYSFDWNSLEFIFNYIVRFMNRIGASPQGIQVVMASISFAAFYVLFRKISSNIALSILLFIVAINSYYFESYNIVRQMIATPFVIFSYLYWNENKVIKSLLFIVIAVGFHMTSIIYFLFGLFAYYTKYNYKTVVITVVTSFIFACVFSSIDLMTSVLGRIFEYGAFLGEFNKYELFMSYNVEVVKTIFGLLSIILFPTFLCIYSYEKLEGNYIARIYFIGVVFLNVVSTFPTSVRMALGMTVLDLLIIPQLWNNYKSKNNKIIMQSSLAALVIFRLYILIATSNSGVVPYSSFI